METKWTIQEECCFEMSRLYSQQQRQKKLWKCGQSWTNCDWFLYLQLHDEVQVVWALVDVLQSYDILMLYPAEQEQKTGFKKNCFWCELLTKVLWPSACALVRIRCWYWQMIFYAGHKNLLCAVENITFLSYLMSHDSATSVSPEENNIGWVTALCPGNQPARF